MKYSYEDALDNADIDLASYMASNDSTVYRIEPDLTYRRVTIQNGHTYLGCVRYDTGPNGWIVNNVLWGFNGDEPIFYDVIIVIEK